MWGGFIQRVKLELEDAFLLMEVTEGENSRETIFAQLQWLSILLAEELRPLREAEQYWLRETRKWKFDFLLFLYINDRRTGIQQLRRIRQSLRIGSLYMGHCEILMNLLQNADSGSMPETISYACKCLDQMISCSPSSPMERAEFLRKLVPGQTEFVVPRSVTEAIVFHIPFYDRPGFGKKIAMLGVGVVSLFVLYGQAVSEISDAERADASTFEIPVESSTWWIMEHILQPSVAILRRMFFNTRQRDEKFTEDAMAVDDARDSFGIMVQNFRKSRNTPTNLTNMEVVSREYERQLSKPIVGALFGDLIELILIQIQYMKKEGLEALLTIDRLIEENWLNTQLAVLAPALLVVGAMYSGIKSIYAVIVDDTSTRSRLKRNFASVLCSLLDNLRKLENGEGEGANGKEYKYELEGIIAQDVYQLSSIIHSLDTSSSLLVDGTLEKLLARNGSYGRKTMLNILSTALN